MKRAGLMSIAAGLLLMACGKKESGLELSYPDFEGETVELISFSDSTVLKSAVVKDGKVIFDNSDLLGKEPRLAQVVIDGRVKGFFIIEEGKALLADSMSVATGTPLNDSFSRGIQQLDSVENLNDMIAYAEFAKKKYLDNKDGVLGEYFGVEWIKYGEPKEVLKMIAESPEKFRKSKKVERYGRYASLRARTAAGEKYADFTATQQDGSRVALSDYVKAGKYTLVDFWASWCPYCVKELPELKELYAKYKDRGFEVVGVAVRDEPADTEAAVKRHGLTWPVIKNAGKVPYDVYGFSGIPHLIRIGPDGRIVARGESAAQTATRLSGIFGD